MKINLKEEDLSEQEREDAQRVLKDSYYKLERVIDFDSLNVHVKVYEKEGKKKKFSVNAVLICSQNIRSDAIEWDLKKAVHKAIDKLVNEIEKRFHVSDQNKP